MKKDPYMMSMTKYEARVREMRRERDISYVAVILGSVLTLPLLLVVGIAGGPLCLVGWLMLAVGIALTSGGTLWYILLRKERKKLEEWKAWEIETQTGLSGSTRHDFE